MTSVADLCSRDECVSPVKYRELCSKHYYEEWRARKTRGVCSLSDCDKPSHTKGLCGYHYKKQWSEVNRVSVQEAQRAYYDRNTERVIARTGQWQRENPDKARENARNHSHRRRSALSSSYTESDIVAEYGSDCHICLLPIDFSAPRKAGSPGWQLSFWRDHYIPIAKGGTDTLDNLRPSHALCNIRKSARMMTLDVPESSDTPLL